MGFEKYKKELVNVKNSIPKGITDNNKWILEFSIVKICGILEQSIYEVARLELKKIQDCKDIKVCLDEEFFCRHIWKSSIDGKQKELLGKNFMLENQEIKRTQKNRNKIAHGNSIDTPFEYKDIITLIGKFDSLIADIENINEESING